MGGDLSAAVPAHGYLTHSQKADVISFVCLSAAELSMGVPDFGWLKS